MSINIWTLHDSNKCTNCSLCLQRIHIVLGKGSTFAHLVIVGEAPGKNEDLKGEPFVGRAGKLLKNLLDTLAFDLTSIYWTNIIKCRPPSNRRPRSDEIEKCLPILKKQLKDIDPKVIIVLGNTAAHALLKTTLPITQLRGQVYKYDDAVIIPTFHPAAALRNKSLKKFIERDLLLAKQMLVQKGVLK